MSGITANTPETANALSFPFLPQHDVQSAVAEHPLLIFKFTKAVTKLRLLRSPQRVTAALALNLYHEARLLTAKPVLILKMDNRVLGGGDTACIFLLQVPLKP